MTPIGLVVRPGHEEALTVAREIISWAAAKNHPLMLEHSAALACGTEALGISPDELVRICDPIITLGGDGTLIGVARYVKEASPVLIGVNFGHLGFLTEIAPQEVFNVLTETLSGVADCNERRLLHTAVERGGDIVFESQVVNDVVVQKGARSKLLDFDFSVDGEAVARIRGDGLIIASPTGSTAYSLAAGGSIAHPSASVMLVTPICPHSLTNRPLILPGEAVLKVVCPAFEDEVLVIIDGQVTFALKGNDSVHVRRTQQTVRFVRSRHKSYFDILRTKLNWGIPNKAD